MPILPKNGYIKKKRASGQNLLSLIYKPVKVIAHGITDPKIARYAISKGVDFVEIDVSKRILSNRFTAQHNSFMGILGLGPILETLLTKEIRARAFLDLKPISYRESFTIKLAELLVKLSVKEVKICGHNWTMLSLLTKRIEAKPYYTIKNQKSLQKFKQVMSKLTKPVGLSVKHDLIDKKLMEFVRNLPAGRQVWAWTVNDIAETKRLIELGVDGIITDNWQSALKLKTVSP